MNNTIEGGKNTNLSFKQAMLFIAGLAITSIVVGALYAKLVYDVADPSHSLSGKMEFYPNIELTSSGQILSDHDAETCAILKTSVNYSDGALHIVRYVPVSGLIKDIRVAGFDEQNDLVEEGALLTYGRKVECGSHRLFLWKQRKWRLIHL